MELISSNGVDVKQREYTTTDKKQNGVTCHTHPRVGAIQATVPVQRFYFTINI